MKYLIGSIVTVVLLVALSRCGTDAPAADTYATEVGGPGGFRCFAIMYNGAAVGGNCVPGGY